PRLDAGKRPRRAVALRERAQNDGAAGEVREPGDEARLERGPARLGAAADDERVDVPPHRTPGHVRERSDVADLVRAVLPELVREASREAAAGFDVRHEDAPVAAAEGTPGDGLRQPLRGTQARRRELAEVVGDEERGDARRRDAPAAVGD